jgi:hypothetical protein
VKDLPLSFLMQDKFGLLLPNFQFLSKDGKIGYLFKTSQNFQIDKRRIKKTAGRNTRRIFFNLLPIS